MRHTRPITLLACLLPYLPLTAWAADAPPPNPLPNTPQADTFVSGSTLPNRLPKPLVQPPVEREQAEQNPETVDRELQFSQAITQALREQQWNKVENLLQQYAQLPDFDAVQYVYVWGLVYRHQNRLPEAISLFGKLLQKRPGLVFVRLNYAVFLFENRQLKEAKAQFEQVAADPNVTPENKALTQKYLKAIASAQSWQFDYGANYTQDNNVNNAPSSDYSPTIYDEYFARLGAKRSPNPPPRVAHGFHYYVSADRSINLAGNHYLQLSGSYNATNYWDAHDYDEKQAYLSVGHQYQTARYSVGANILGTQNWLGASRYAYLYGIGTSAVYRLSPKHQFGANYGYLRRFYHHEEDQGYDSNINQISFSYLYQPNAEQVWYIGTDASREHAKTRFNTSTRYGISGGWYRNKPNSFGWRFSTRYGWRNFEGRPFYILTDATDRRDRELSFQAAFWHNRLQWKGFIPKFNIQWNNVRSNIPDWYNRQNYGAYVSVERAF